MTCSRNTLAYLCLFSSFVLCLIGCSDSGENTSALSNGSKALKTSKVEKKRKKISNKGVSKKLIGSSLNTSSSPLIDPKPEADTEKLTEREVAQRILALGGRVEVLVAGKRMNINAGESLPTSPFIVVSCYLSTEEFKPRDLLMLKNLSRLLDLELGFSDLEDENFEILEELPDLEYLSFGARHFRYIKSFPKITNKGLRLLAKCKSLKIVGIGNSPNITGDGLRHLAANPQIHDVMIVSNPHLKANDFKQLTKPGRLSNFTLLHQPKTPIPALKIEALNGVPSLYFHNCDFDEASIDSLCKLPNIKKATFSHCKITKSQEEKLRTSLKGAKLWMPNLRPKRK